jgi:pyridoxal phosphate enzyme (YggS family)
MHPIQERLNNVLQHIRNAEQDFSRAPGSVMLLAVSKTRPTQDVREAIAAGQKRFGESRVQEALEKIRELSDYNLEWHFIGRIQSNKTRAIAEHFHWLHSLDNIKNAQRLSAQRPDAMAPLKVCLQINVSGEISKGGFRLEQAQEAAALVHDLPGLELCGLMAIPARAETLQQQRQPFRLLRELRDRLVTTDLPLATLSMGMTDDLEAAIAEGATMVRVGTAIFGPRR